MLYSRILAAGRALPARYVTNDELAAELARDGIETSDEWIRTRTGIEGRYIAEEGLTTLELARRASVEALQRAGGFDRRRDDDAGYGFPFDCLSAPGRVGRSGLCGV